MKATLQICLLLICFIVIGCSKDDAESVSIKDPEGTITLDITNSSIENQIYISNGNLQGGLFAEIGKINGLGNITSIPCTGWSTQVAATEKHGYVGWINGTYYRIYLSTYNAEKTLVKYQQPFLGSENEIIPAKTTILFDKEASYQEITFSNKTLFPYTVKSSEDWYRVYPISSIKNSPYNALKIVVTANAKPEERNSSISILSDIGDEITLNVNQQAGDAWLSIEKSELNIEGDASSSQIRISSNAKWNAQSNSTWCKVEQNENLLMINADENDSGKSRTAIITVTTENKKEEKQITVNQKAPTLDVSKNSLEFEGAVDSDTFTVSSNISVWTVESNQTWCKVQKDGNLITVNVDENHTGTQRSAIISVAMLGKTERINVIQKIPTFSISKKAFSFDGCASEDNFIVTSNIIGWNVTSNQSWCTVKRTGQILTVSVSENSSGQNREALVIVKMPDGRKEDISVLQIKPILAVTSDIINVNRTQSSINFANISNVSSWQVDSDAAWCSVSNVNGILQISVEENATLLKREANIRVRLYNDTVSIPVIQNARDIGDYYASEYGDGIVFEISDYGEHGKIVSIDEKFQAQWFFCSANEYMDKITSLDNGMDNLTVVKMFCAENNYRFEKFEAMAWCQNKGADWYLPAINELISMMRQIDVINESILAIPLPNNAQILDNKHGYWSSSRGTKSRFDIYSFGGQIQRETDRTTYLSVRAIKAF